MPARNRPIILLTRCVFFLALASIAVAALYPNLKLPEPILTRGFTDKIYHALGFIALVWLAGTAWEWTYKLMLVLLALAITLELSQFLTEGRGVFLDDVMANIGGVAIGAMLLWMTTAWQQRRTKRN